MTLGISSHRRGWISKSSVASILSCMVSFVTLRKWGLPKVQSPGLICYYLYSKWLAKVLHINGHTWFLSGKAATRVVRPTRSVWGSRCTCRRGLKGRDHATIKHKLLLSHNLLSTITFKNSGFARLLTITWWWAIHHACMDLVVEACEQSQLVHKASVVS